MLAVRLTGGEDAGPRVLPEDAWLPRARAHRQRAEAYTGPHLERRAQGTDHPVLDFLFDYYSFEPAKLARWHPGAGTVLAGAAARDYLDLAAYRCLPGGLVGVDLERLTSRMSAIRFIRDLLVRTAGRTARLDCLGLHEWAMVYRTPQDRVRHGSWPLRLGTSGTDAVVEQHRIRCTHFDAYRFFAEPARPHNELEPTRATQPQLEQPGCLHANMDLYRWATKLSPFGDADLLLDAFELAHDLRVLDMRASPYDLSRLGYEPVKVEEPEGKAEYVRAQRGFAIRAQEVRRRLVADCDRLLSLLPEPDR